MDKSRGATPEWVDLCGTGLESKEGRSPDTWVRCRSEDGSTWTDDLRTKGGDGFKGMSKGLRLNK